ncbi:MAG: hypothetical protein ACYCZ6_16440 [Polaromonas sp.]
MRWEVIAAIGQVLGAFGVIASLLYLATQVRQNNRASAVAAKLASTQLLSEFVDSLITDPELMDLWLRGRKNLASLNDIEHFRFANMCLKAFWFFSAAQFQLRIGTLREEDWVEFHAVIRFWLEGEGVQAWWSKTGKTRFGKSFVLFIDGEIARHCHAVIGKNTANPSQPDALRQAARKQL